MNTQLFWSRVERTANCWHWRGTKDRDGYGVFGKHVAGQSRRAHRISWELLRGEIPAGKQLDHLCRNADCVNPEHLEPVTSRENSARGNTTWAQVARTGLCSRGHKLTGGGCRECENQKKRELKTARDAAGVCVECGRERKPGKRRCVRCLDAINRRSKAYFHRTQQEQYDAAAAQKRRDR